MTGNDETYDPKTIKDRLDPKEKRRYLEYYGVKCLAFEEGFAPSYEVGKYYVVKNEELVQGPNTLPEIEPMLDDNSQPIELMERQAALLDDGSVPGQITTVKVLQLDRARFRKVAKHADTGNLVQYFDTAPFSEVTGKIYLLWRHEVDAKTFEGLKKDAGMLSEDENDTEVQLLLTSRVREILHVPLPAVNNYTWILRLGHASFDVTEYYLWQTKDEDELEEEFEGDAEEERSPKLSTNLARFRVYIEPPPLFSR